MHRWQRHVGLAWSRLRRFRRETLAGANGALVMIFRSLLPLLPPVKICGLGRGGRSGSLGAYVRITRPNSSTSGVTKISAARKGGSLEGAAPAERGTAATQGCT